MGDRTRRVVLCVLIGSATALGGCGGGTSTGGFAAATIAGQPTVGNTERGVVQAAARQMTGAAEARVHGLSARIAPGEEGLDICGFVDTPSDASLPLYVELRETEGSVTAQRGQVGATPGKLAKVRFMCRRH